MVGSGGTLGFVDLMPCLVACRCPYAVATGLGVLRLTLAAVKPGTRIKPLSIAAMNVETDGDPNVACQKFTKSAAESNRTAAYAVFSDAVWALPSAAVVDSNHP